MWGSCLTGGAVFSLGCAASRNEMDGGGVHRDVESVSQGEYERSAEDAAVGAAGAGRRGVGEGGQAAVEARREAGAQDEQRENTGCAYGKGRGEGGEGTGGPGAQGGEGARRVGARRGNYPDGALNNHTGGHSAVTEGGGCAGPHLEGLPSCCGGPRPLVRVWLQGPGGWCQRQVGGMDGLQRAVRSVWGAPAGEWWLVRGGKVLRDMEEDQFEDDHIQVSEELGGGGARRDRLGHRGGRLGGIMVRWRWRR